MEQMKRPNGLNINIGPEDMKDITCAECGSKYFRQVNAFKKLSALVSPTGKEFFIILIHFLSPTGKEQIVPIPVFRCDECGFINEEFRPIEGKKDN